MLDVLFNESITIRRPTGRTAANAITYEQAKNEDGTGIVVRCRIEETRRRVIGTDGIQTESDATMVFRVNGNPVIGLEDVVIRDSGTAYRVIGINAQQAIGTPYKYARLDLALTKQLVPEDEEDV